MKKIVKFILWTLLTLVILLGGGLWLFVYKITNGFPVSYETEKPAIQFPPNQPAILVFSKTTGFRHGESIEASQPVFTQMGTRNQWFVYQTEDGGVFNPDQLKQFKAVIFNNSTGRVLNDEQQNALAAYVEAGGTLLGIHGAGDNSHHWPWYEENLLGTTFSHHPLNPQLQQAEVTLQTPVDSSWGNSLPAHWQQTDEWYIFFSQPKGTTILYAIDGNKVIPDGNMLWIKDKNFGMGKLHPVAWYKAVGQGRTFYTSMGHTKEVWSSPEFVRVIENVLQRSVQ